MSPACLTVTATTCKHVGCTGGRCDAPAAPAPPAIQPQADQAAPANPPLPPNQPPAAQAAPANPPLPLTAPAAPAPPVFTLAPGRSDSELDFMNSQDVKLHYKTMTPSTREDQFNGTPGKVAVFLATIQDWVVRHYHHP